MNKHVFLTLKPGHDIIFDISKMVVYIMNVLYTWLGHSDFRAMQDTPSSTAKGNETEPKKNGPVADAVRYLAFAQNLKRVVLLADFKDDGELQRAEDYREWLKKQLALWIKKRLGESVEVILNAIKKGDPTNYNWAFDALRKAADNNESDPALVRHYLVGPGTPTMASCTVLISRLCEGQLWQADEKHLQGCRKLELPFEITLKDGPDPASYAANRAPAAQLEAGIYSGDAVVCSASTQRAYTLALRAAASDWPVLVLGSSGTGKEGLVKYIHNCGRTNKPFIPLNCAAIPKDLIESELFGHKKGAFTGAVKDKLGAFEEAKDGTLFLDEIGELPLDSQSKLLRVLQEEEFTRVGELIKIETSCRIIAATHRNLWRSVEEGSFRLDLYYRLAGLIITLDDLSKRPEDLVELIDRYWQKTVLENPGFPGKTLGNDARERLLAHSWPGNIRELAATLARISFLAESPRVTAKDVVLSLSSVENVDIRINQVTDQVLSSPKTSTSSNLGFQAQVKNYQRQLLENAIGRAEGNKSRAAQELGISYQQLNRLLKD